jgi:hypothetical protein
MPWAVAATVAVGLYSADQQAGAAEDAANAQRDGADAATAEQRRQYDQTRQDQMPWLNAGTSALGQMQALNSGDFSSFKESPDYQFTLQQGIQAGDRGAAARGGLYSGGHSADLMKYGQGLASQQYGTYYSRLSDLANGGNATAGSLGQLGGNMANQIGNNMNNAAAGRASSYLSRGDAYSQAAAGVGGAFNNWYQNNSAQNGGGSGWYLGSNPGKG